MPIGDVCVRDVAIGNKDMTVLDAAQLMRRLHVGNVVLTEESPTGRKVPVGIVTDRDIVVSVVATGLDPSVYTIGDLVTEALVTAHEDEGIFEALHRMRVRAVRRMPVVNREGGLVGIISVDDLIQLLAEEMSDLAKLISREQAREAQSRR